MTHIFVIIRHPQQQLLYIKTRGGIREVTKLYAWKITREEDAQESMPNMGWLTLIECQVSRLIVSLSRPNRRATNAPESVCMKCQGESSFTHQHTHERKGSSMHKHVHPGKFSPGSFPLQKSTSLLPERGAVETCRM